MVYGNTVFGSGQRGAAANFFAFLRGRAGLCQL